MEEDEHVIPHPHANAWGDGGSMPNFFDVCQINIFFVPHPHANAWGYGVSMPKFFRFLALFPALRGFNTFLAAIGYT